MKKVMATLFFLVLLVTAGTVSQLSAGDEEKQLSVALQRALDNSDYARKKRLAELIDVADPDWPGFRLVGPDGRLRLGAAATGDGSRAEQGPSHQHAEGDLSCAVCGAHLFDGKNRVDSESDVLLYARPTTSSSVVTDIHSEWSSEAGRIELRCALCGNHLGHVDPGGTRETALRFAIEPDQVEGDQEP